MLGAVWVLRVPIPNSDFATQTGKAQGCTDSKDCSEAIKIWWDEVHLKAPRDSIIGPPACRTPTNFIFLKIIVLDPCKMFLYPNDTTPEFECDPEG